MNARSAPLGPPDVETWWQNRPHSVADWFDAAPVETQADVDARLAAMARADTDRIRRNGPYWWLKPRNNPVAYGGPVDRGMGD
jgi:hypothetical protein